MVPALLPPVTCVDVGASYYPHPAWEMFRRSPRTTWVAIDPNADNLEYIKRWRWPSRVVPVGDAVSESGGDATLYITNVDSGSSLLEPVIAAGMVHRTDPDYFFPVRERRIATRRLADVLAEHGAHPAAIKLDTQGTEFHILRGVDDAFIRDRVVCIELESTLLAEPYYAGSAKMHEILPYLEERGFELLHLVPIQGSYPVANPRLGGRRALNECDAVFTLRQDLAERRPPDHRLALLGCYLAYQFHGEALHLTRELLAAGEGPSADLRALEQLLS